MNKVIILLLLLFSLNMFAKNADAQTRAKGFRKSMEKQELQNDDYVRVGESKEEPLSRSNLRKQLDVTKGIPDEGHVLKFQEFQTGLYHKYDLLEDKSHWSFVFHMNGNFIDLEEVRTIEGVYGWNFAENMWLKSFFAITSATFEAMTETNSSQGTEESLETTYETLLHVGVGFGTKTTFIRDFFNFDGLYETWGSYLVASRLDERFFSQSYSGLGVRADYGMHYRFSRPFHIGLKMSWHLYSMKRGEDFPDESQSARHLLLNWLSVGLDWTFYW